MRLPYVHRTNTRLNYNPFPREEWWTIFFIVSVYYDTDARKSIIVRMHSTISSAKRERVRLVYLISWKLETVIYNTNTSRCILMYPTYEYSCGGLLSHMDRFL